MMSFMLKKKRFKFLVNFELEELLSVPFVSGIVFAKIRLLDGGSFTDVSNREEIGNNRVKWHSSYSFQSKLTASANTGVLEPCVCRVSVRKELKGGRAYQKLGFADINLAEFAGGGCQCRMYLLEGYDSKHRQTNSTLKVSIEMTLVSGDPVFKVPQNASMSSGDPVPSEHYETRVDDASEGSVASKSSGFGSLPRRDKPSVMGPESLQSADVEGSSGKEFESAHSRSSSSTSQQSRGSGYGSLTCGHSRQSSAVGNEAMHGHARSPSTGSAFSDASKSDSRRRKLEDPKKDHRVDSTRIDNENLIDELIKGTNLSLDETEKLSGLQLVVGKDGTTVLR